MLISKALIRAFFIGTAVLLIASPSIVLAEDYIQLNASLLFDLVNKHRLELNLLPFQKDERICQIAESRTPQLYDEIFAQGTMHKGFYERNLSYWATENMIYMRNEKEALDWWLNSYIHRQAIESNHPYSCIACTEQACSAIFTSFLPKYK